MSLTALSKAWPHLQAETSLMLRKLPAFCRGLPLLLKSNKSEKLSLGTFIERNAELSPEGLALLYEDRRYTHAEFNEWVNRTAHYFLARGLKRGDVGAIFMENRPDVLVCVAALAKLGAIAALINTTQREKTLLHSFTLATPSLYLIGEELLEPFQQIQPHLPSTASNSFYFVAETRQKALPEGWGDLEMLTKTTSRVNPPTTQHVQLGDPCFYIYTSGTTGLPKASIMTHFRWLKAGSGMGMLCLNMKPEDILYLTLPLYHNNALTVAWASALTGGSAIALRRKFSASQFWEDTRRFQATCFCYIGELCRYLMNQPPKPNDAENPVYKIIGNGLRPDLWKAFKARFGIEEVYEFYGASEGNIGFANIFNRDCTVGTCPVSYALVKYDIETDSPVRNAQGFLQRVSKGEVGLLLGEVTAKASFDGYTDPNASEKKLWRNVFKKGDVWFNSGDLLRDLGFRHAQFVDRLGDTFRWKGENVSTTEIEEILNQFPHVNESTVYGVALPQAEGRAGMASVVSPLKAEAFDFPGLLAHLQKSLASYAIPVFIRLKSELEITGTFKHRKVDLKREGFDLTQVQDPIYVWLPKSTGYIPLTPQLAQAIQQGQYAF